jgi:hypothetical protein
MTREFFWCEANKQQYDIEVCLNRRMKKMKGCTKCKQGKQIENNLRGKRKENPK